MYHAPGDDWGRKSAAESTLRLPRLSKAGKSLSAGVTPAEAGVLVLCLRTTAALQRAARTTAQDKVASMPTKAARAAKKNRNFPLFPFVAHAPLQRLAWRMKIHLSGLGRQAQPRLPARKEPTPSCNHGGCREEKPEEEAHPSPPFAKDATGFGDPKSNMIMV